MLQESLHVHLIHDIKAILSLNHMQNRLWHEFVKNQDIVALLKEQAKTIDEILLKQLAFSNQRVDLLLFNFVTNSVDQQGHFYCVVLRDQWIQFRVFGMKNILINIDQVIHLLNWKNVKVLMNYEKFHLVEKNGILNGGHHYVHNFLVNINMDIKKQGVNQHSYLEGIIPDANDE